MQSFYETILITAPGLTEDEEGAAVANLSEVIDQHEGKLVIKDRMGRRRLAYPIRKHEDGVYTRLLYDSTADVPREIERRAGINDKVLRLLTVKLEQEWARDARAEAARLIEEWAKPAPAPAAEQPAANAAESEAESEAEAAEPAEAAETPETAKKEEA